jgi:predicted metalloprotease
MNGPGRPAGRRAAATDEMGAYMGSVLAMTEDVWSEIVAESGEVYQEPILVLFGAASSLFETFTHGSSEEPTLARRRTQDGADPVQWTGEH